MTGASHGFSRAAAPVWGFSRDMMGRDLGSIPGLGRFPGEGNSYPLQYSSLEEFHGLYSSWGHKESDMTERLPHITSKPF